MKNKLLIIAGVALAGIAALIVSKRWSNEEPNTAPKKSHHLTNAFSRAKEYAVHQ